MAFARPRAVPRLGASGSGQRPAGAIAVTERAWPAAASSSATQPPSELPATWCGPPGRSRAGARATAAASAAGVGGPPPLSDGRVAEAGQVERDHVALARPAGPSRAPTRAGRRRAGAGARAPGPLRRGRRRSTRCCSAVDGGGEACGEQRGAAGDDERRRGGPVGQTAAAGDGREDVGEVPATLAARNGRSGKPRSAAAIAAPCTTISRAPSPRSGTWVGGAPAAGPSQRRARRSGAAISAAP